MKAVHLRTGENRGPGVSPHVRRVFSHYKKGFYDTIKRVFVHIRRAGACCAVGGGYNPKNRFNQSFHTREGSVIPNG